MTDKKRIDTMSGFCRLPGADDHGHKQCRWSTGYETPSAILTCTCPCHTARVMVAKGPRAEAAGRKMVPKS